MFVDAFGPQQLDHGEFTHARGEGVGGEALVKEIGGQVETNVITRAAEIFSILGPPSKNHVKGDVCEEGISMAMRRVYVNLRARIGVKGALNALNMRPIPASRRH